MKFGPVVSVVVPCYDQGLYLAEALDSVRYQVYSLWECLIVNDGSHDDTEVVALKYVALDSRFKYFVKDNGGLSDARNFGISRSSGELVLPLDADDKIGPSYIEEAVKVFGADPLVSIVYCRAEYFGQRQGRWELSYKGYENLLLTNSIFCSALFRRSDFDIRGGYDREMRRGFEDWEFWIRMLDAQSKVQQLDSVHFYYRFKGKSMVQDLVRNREVEASVINYVIVKHIEKYSKHFGGLTHYVREQRHFKFIEGRIRSRFVSKLLFYLSRRLAGLS